MYENNNQQPSFTVHRRPASSNGAMELCEIGGSTCAILVVGREVQVYFTSGTENKAVDYCLSFSGADLVNLINYGLNALSHIDKGDLAAFENDELLEELTRRMA